MKERSDKREKSGHEKYLRPNLGWFLLNYVCHEEGNFCHIRN